MARNDTYIHGMKWETAFLEPSWTPAVSDVFYLLGEDIAGEHSPIAPEVNIHPIYKKSIFDPVELVSGKKVLKGEFVATPYNGLPAYLMLGNSVTASSIHTLTTSTTGLTKSMIWHYEARGGTTDILRDCLGCKAGLVGFEWNLTGNDASLQFFMSMLGAYERTATHATKPAKQLTTAPIFHPGTTEEEFSKCVTTTWNDIAIEPGFFQIQRGRDLMPVYRQNGIAGNDSKREWPIAIRHTSPNITTFNFNFMCDIRDVHEAAIVTASNSKTLVFKFEKPSDSTKYIEFSLANCMIAKPTYIETDNDDRAIMMTSGFVTTPTINVKDGVAASFYGE